MGGVAIQIYFVCNVGIQMIVMAAASCIQLSTCACFYHSATTRDVARGLVWFHVVCICLHELQQRRVWEKQDKMVGLGKGLTMFCTYLQIPLVNNTGWGHTQWLLPLCSPFSKQYKYPQILAKLQFVCVLETYEKITIFLPFNGCCSASLGLESVCLLTSSKRIQPLCPHPLLHSVWWK